MGRPAAVRGISRRPKSAQSEPEYLAFDRRSGDGRDIRRLAKGRGSVGCELHFDMTLQFGAKTILLPDVAFVRRERLFGLSEKFLQVPNFAPDVAVEIRSPSDRPGIREWKGAIPRGRFRPGARRRPGRRTIRAFAPGMDERTFAQGETFQHPAAPWLASRSPRPFRTSTPRAGSFPLAGRAGA